MSRRIAFAAAQLATAAVLGALNWAAPARAESAADTLVLQLHGPAQFEFAGYFAALWKGYYKAAGLTVEIRPGVVKGAAPVDPVREVEAGRAQFGTGDGELLVRTVQGLPLLLLAPIFQQSGVMIYSRTDSDITSPAALLKARVGRLPASNPLDIELVTALRAEGIDPARLNSVSLAAGRTVAALAERQVDAVPGSAWEFPWLAHQRNLQLKSFNPASYRVEFYGDTLFALQRFERTDPDAVRRFRAASLQGWAYALDHSDEIVARLGAELPPPPGIADPAGFEHYQAEVARRLSRYKEVPLGRSNRERWGRVEATLADAGAVVRTADPASFLYDPDAEARASTDTRTWAILAASALVVVVAAFGLLRWRRRAVPPPQPQAQPEPLPAEAAVPAADADFIGPRLPPPPEPAAPAIAEPPPPRQPEPVDLNVLLQELEPALRERVVPPAHLRFSLLPDLWRCRADGAAIGPLLLDLVAAATADGEHTDDLIIGSRNYRFDAGDLAQTPGAQIGDFARLTVRDNGRGLPSLALDRVFDPTVTRRPAVAAAWPLMQQLGGFARVESAEGVGTAVHLYLPRAAAAPEAQPAPGRRFRSAPRRGRH